MRNFLVALVLNHEEFYFWTKEVKTTNPEEVICPKKTLYFFFKKGKNIEEVRKELVYLRIGRCIALPDNISDDGKMYIRGTKISEDEVFNSECDLIITFDDNVTVVEE